VVRGFTSNGVKRVITRIDVAAQNATMLVAATLVAKTVYILKTDVSTYIAWCE
jgi:hypothetical protein